MATVILGFVVMMFIVLAMSVGVLFGRKPLKGSCGGLSALGMKESCDICGGEDDLCDKEQLRQKALASAELGYDAMQPRRVPLD